MTVGLVFHFHPIFQVQIHLAISLNSAGQFLINFYVQSNFDGSNLAMTVGASLTHPWVQAIPRLVILEDVHVNFMFPTAHFYRLKRTVHVSSVAY